MDPNQYDALYFAGGEALTIDEHYELLEEVIQRGPEKYGIEVQSNAVEER